MKATLQKPLLWGLVGLLVVLGAAVGHARAGERGRDRQRVLTTRTGGTTIIIIGDRDRDRDRDKHKDRYSDRRRDSRADRHTRRHTGRHIDRYGSRTRRYDHHYRRPLVVRSYPGRSRETLFYRSLPHHVTVQRRISYLHHSKPRLLTNRRPMRSGASLSIVINLR